MTGRDLTDTEVALILDRPKRTVQRWAQSGRLEGAHKVGRAWRIPESVVEALVGHGVESLRSGLEDAVGACERLRSDVNSAASMRLRWGRRLSTRDWDAVAADLARIEAAISGVRGAIERYR